MGNDSRKAEEGRTGDVLVLVLVVVVVVVLVVVATLQ